MIKVIVFDYADVISPGPLTAWNKANLLPDNKKFITYKQNSLKWDLGEMNLDEMYKFLGELTNTSPDLVWDKFYKPLMPDEKIINLIKKLKNNYKIFLFSNFVGKQLRKLLEMQGIINLFDEILVSSEYKLMKPDPKFFEVLVEKACVQKQEIIFTDDSLKNIESANVFGIKSFVFTNTENFIKDLQKEGVKID